MDRLNTSDEGRSEVNLVADDSDHKTWNLESPKSRFIAYHLSHGRGQRILARIQEMLACRARGRRMFHVRISIKHSRMAELHRQCADIERDPDLDQELLHLFEEYIPISGALTSDEYDKLLSGVGPVPKPFNPLRGSRMCRACRNLNLRRESFQSGTPRFVTSIMGDLSIDKQYSDEELMRKLGRNATFHDVKHHKLGDLQDIAARSECSFCRLVADCFMRLSEKEIVHRGFDWAIPNFCYDGVVWLSVVPDSAGDHPKGSSSKGHHQTKNQLDDFESPVTTGRTRIILSLIAEGEEPTDSSFEPPVKTLHSEIFPYAEDDEDAAFHIRQWSTPYIDTQRPQKWLHVCETYHGDACSAPPNYERMEVHEDMLLIDVEDECLVSGFKSRSYIALTYVWGSSQATSFQTNKATLEEVMTPGGLPWDKEGLAKTISDAMHFTHEMKVRYLWVDALCIVQDDEDSKYHQIMHMDAIYRQAILTIVAADNLGADDGICGLGSRSRENFQRTYEYRPDLIITANEAVIGDVEVQVMQTKWARRAWTFQERIFSRRLLIFMNSTVYWNCACLSWSEAEPNPSEDGPPPWEYYNAPIFRDNPRQYLKGLDLPGDNSINFVWTNIVVALADLDLSFEDDILFALGGMENYIAQYFTTSFICGHPTKNFLDFLLWAPLGSPWRRRNAPNIPSWSWASWVGRTVYCVLEPQKKHENLRISTPAWGTEVTQATSHDGPHPIVLNIHTMTSKIHIVGSMHSDGPFPTLTELGSMGVSMPVEVRDKDGKCVGGVTVLPLEEVDGIFEAIVIAEKLPKIDEHTKVALAYWIMLIEWKGEVAERIGLGLITVKGWHGTNPVWSDVRLG